MSQTGEATAIAVEEEEPKEDEKKIKIRYSVFFDGTLNNRTNIDQRLVSTDKSDLDEDERRAAEELEKKMSVEDIKKAKGIYKKFKEGGNSYENGYTNVVKLERHVDTNSPPKDYQLMLKTYVEGPGTRDKKKDDAIGYGLGMGFLSGVKKKVTQGVKDVVNKASLNIRRKDVMIEKLTLDVFGFSRGAAAARHFIYKAILVENSVKKMLRDKGYKVGKVEVCFAGLFDTVSSHGFKFSNDTAELSLDSIVHAKQVVHLAAADEHRENFSLTTTESAKSKGGIEIFLPGVHSDVGGSYREGASENHDIFWTMGGNGEEEAKAQIRELVDAGWYKEDNLTIKKSTRRPGGKHTLKEVNLHAERSNISNQYSRIPLHIMAKFTRENEITLNPKLDYDEKIIPELNVVKIEVDKYVNQHKGKGAYTSKATDWHDNTRAWLCDLRYGYFHFSARLELGNGPRYINGKRERMYYAG